MNINKEYEFFFKCFAEVKASQKGVFQFQFSMLE